MSCCRLFCFCCFCCKNKDPSTDPTIAPSQINSNNENLYFLHIEVFNDAKELKLTMRGEHNNTSRISLIIEKLLQFCDEAYSKIKNNTEYTLEVTPSENPDDLEKLFHYIKTHTTPKQYDEFVKCYEAAKEAPCPAS